MGSLGLFSSSPRRFPPFASGSIRTVVFREEQPASIMRSSAHLNSNSF
jgi:hypothetical protein